MIDYVYILSATLVFGGELHDKVSPPAPDSINPDVKRLSDFQEEIGIKIGASKYDENRRLFF